MSTDHRQVSVVGHPGRVSSVSSRQPPVTARRAAVPLLASPGFTGAVAVLLVNDHLLKRAVPGAVTGKLSDVAGLVVVAVLARCVVRNDVVAVAVTGASFIVLKTTVQAALAAAPVLGGVTRRDPSDLWALAVLVPVHMWFRRRREQPPLRLPPISLLQIPAVGIAVLATTATSCAEPSWVDRFVTDGTVVWAGITGTAYGPDGRASDELRWARSDDGGRHWAASDPPAAGAVATDEACTHLRCWRTIPGQRVEVDNGNGWEAAFAFSAEQWRQQELASTSACDDPRDRTFGSVTIVAGDAGQSVVVTMGTQGIVRYDGDGWQRIGVLDRVPAAMPGPSWLSRVPVWTVLGLGAAAVVLVVSGSSRWAWGRPEKRWHTAAAIAGVGAGSLLIAVGGLSFFAGHLYPIWAALTMGVAVGVFIASVVTVARPLRPLPPPVSLARPAPPDSPQPRSSSWRR